MAEEIPNEEAELMCIRASNAVTCLNSDGELALDVLRLLRERKHLQRQLLLAQGDCDGERCLFAQH